MNRFSSCSCFGFTLVGWAQPTKGVYMAETSAKEVVIWIFHWAQDNVVLASYSTDMVIALRKAGGKVKYTLYKDANHNSWDNALAEPRSFDWLFSNSRNY